MIGTVGASLVLILTFDLCYWPRAPETLVISWVTGVSFVLGRQLWIGSWVAPGWGLDMKKTNLWLDAWNFRFHIPFSRKWRRAENGINDQSCLHNDTSIKSPKYRAQWASGWWTRGDLGRVVHLEGAWKLCILSPCLALWIFSILLFLCYAFSNETVI